MAELYSVGGHARAIFANMLRHKGIFAALFAVLIVCGGPTTKQRFH
jgi:hypothetical protein